MAETEELLLFKGPDSPHGKVDVYHGRQQATHIGTMYQEVDGYYVFAFNPQRPLAGFLPEDFFLCIARKLMALNAEWHAVIMSDTSIGPGQPDIKIPSMNFDTHAQAEEGMKALVQIMQTLTANEMEQFVKAAIAFQHVLRDRGNPGLLALAYTLCDETMKHHARR